MNIQQSDRLTQSQKDSMKIVLFNDSTRIDTLLQLNGVDKVIYEQTINYYDEHPELWLKVFTTVESKLEKLEKEDKDKINSSQRPSPPQK